MVEGLLTTAAEGILNKALSLAANEIVLAWGFKKDLTALHDTLKTIQAVLEDAEKRQEKEARVKLWMERLKVVSIQADDVLDEVQYEVLRRKVEIRNQMVRKIFFFFSSSNPIAFRLKMGHKIKHINTQLAKINKDARDYQLQPQVGDHPIQDIVNRETDSFLDEFGVIGRENDELLLVETLIGSSNEEDLAVIPVVGMGGLGKTTLAKLIFNNEQVKGHFKVKVWVCVSDNFDVKMLLTQILESVMEKKVELHSREDIIRKLQAELEGKKYLLVLDDVWNTDPTLWDEFRSCLLKVNKGSGNNILITTRSKEVGSITKTSSFMHIVDQLSDEQCSFILQKRAFAAGGLPKTQELVDIADEIAKKCCGVPLVATVVGSMLRNKENIDQWLSIQRSGVWDVGGDKVQNILKLSFDNLSKPLLKHCFAYCSIFQKDAVMDKEQLIQLWMALGFLQGNEAENKDMEDVGEESFKILSQSSLFQDFKKDGHGNITGCKMHDLVHDLALSLSYETFNSEASTCHGKVRHLALHSGKEAILRVLKEKQKARYLHTLFFTGYYVPVGLSLKFECLRILHLRHANLQTLSDSIGELVHLRYLNLSQSAIEFLPKSIGKLYNLQILRIDECHSLKIFPKEIRKLVSLRHFYFDERHMDSTLEVGRLTCLRTLPFFHVGREKGHLIEVLGCLKHLRGKLKVCNLENVSNKEEAQSADLVGKGNLYGLEYVWSDKREGSKAQDKEVLDGLQAPPNLKSLELEGFMGDNFPEWLLKMEVSTINGTCLPLQNLVYIKFSNCSRCEHVPMLGQLPFLQTLELSFMSNVKCLNSLFYGINYDTSTSSGGVSRSKPLFPALRSFEIRNMEKLETWMDESATTGGGINRVVVFPCLEKLYIENCSGLTSLPSGLLGSCTSLRTLRISFCSGLTSLPSGLLGSCTSLRELTIWDCSGLTSLPSGLLGSCTSLWRLEIEECPNLMTLPELHNQSHSLQLLKIIDCLKLGCLPEGYFKVLNRLRIGPMSEDPQILKLSLQAILRNSNVKLSLRSLRLKGRSEWESIPEEVQHLTVLTSIWLEEFGSVEALPDWFANLSSLEDLRLWRCSKLKSLPSMEAMQRLTKLKSISIYYCPRLTERVAEGSGPEWSKIAHIPHRRIF